MYLFLAALCLVVLSTMTAKAVTPFTTPDALLMHYAQFGNSEDESLVTVNGDVGVSAGGSLHVFSPSVINGDVYIDQNATFTDDKKDYSNIHGNRFYNQNLTAEQNQVLSSSAYLSSLPTDPGETFTNLKTAMSFSNNIANTALVVNIAN